MSKIIPRLFANIDANVYGVMDGASLKVNTPLFLEEYDLESACLFRGELEPDLAARAPCLIKLTRDSEFLKLWLDDGWGKHWGIFVISYADMRVMRRHLRRFLKVRGRGGQVKYFRFYDPRVLNNIVSIFNEEQIAAFFNDIRLAYMAENKDKELVSFVCRENKVVTT